MLHTKHTCPALPIQPHACVLQNFFLVYCLAALAIMIREKPSLFSTLALLTIKVGTTHIPGNAKFTLYLLKADRARWSNNFFLLASTYYANASSRKSHCTMFLFFRFVILFWRCPDDSDTLRQQQQQQHKASSKQ